MFVDVVAVACVLVLAASGITYTLIQNIGVESPFNVKPENWQVGLYFLDHAMKGAFFDFCEVFQVSLQKTLTHRAAFDNPFAYGIVTYRLLMNFLTLQIILLSATYIFFARRDERVTIPDELHKAKQAASAASSAYYGLKREVEDKQALQKAKRILNGRDYGKFVRITREKDEGRYVDRKSYKWWLDVCRKVGLDHDRDY
ncbi:MAG: hypothetical protein F9K29_23755 [Hyphomicrobiaceae bacterium]|nr:MAG: hypothetical protein F9K29_23755 [Hyphomicrobiaceae bacterium]